MQRLTMTALIAVVLGLAMPAQAFVYDDVDVSPTQSDLTMWRRATVEAGDWASKHCLLLQEIELRYATLTDCVIDIAQENPNIQTWDDFRQLQIGSTILLPDLYSPSNLPTGELITFTSEVAPERLQELDAILLRLNKLESEDVSDQFDRLINELHLENVFVTRDEFNSLETAIRGEGGLATRIADLEEKGFLTRDSLLLWVNLPYTNWRVPMAPILAGIVLLASMLGALAFFGIGPVGRMLKKLFGRVDALETIARLSFDLATDGRVRIHNPPSLKQIADLKWKKHRELGVPVVINGAEKVFVIEYMEDEDLFVVQGSFGRPRSMAMRESTILPHLAKAIRHELDQMSSTTRRGSKSA